MLASEVAMETIEEKGIRSDPMKASLLSAAQKLEAAAAGDRAAQLAGLRDAAIAIESTLDLLAAESRPGGSNVLKARVLPQAETLQGRLRELLVRAWETDRAISAGGASGLRVFEAAAAIRKVANDVLTLVHDSMAYEDAD
jgi:hypothetical protein